MHIIDSISPCIQKPLSRASRLATKLIEVVHISTMMSQAHEDVAVVVVVGLGGVEGGGSSGWQSPFPMD
jgi:hypothetical protein